MKSFSALLVLIPLAALAATDSSDGARLERGKKQVAAMWRAEDGSAAEQKKFVGDEFVATGAALDGMFARYEEILEQLDGHFLEIERALQRHVELDLGPVDLARQAHGRARSGGAPDGRSVRVEDRDRRAAQLPAHDAAAAPRRGRQMVAAAMGGSAAGAALRAARAGGGAGQDRGAGVGRRTCTSPNTTSSMHHLVDASGARPFPRGMRLISHWNLRDELKADYAAKAWAAEAADDRAGHGAHRRPDDPEDRHQQRDASIGIRSPTRSRRRRPRRSRRARLPAKIDPAREPDTRYRVLLDDFLASRAADPFTPTTPTMIARRFDHDREIPEARFVAMMEEVLTSPLAPRIAKLIEQAARPQARAVRPLVRRLPRARDASRGRARRADAQALSDARRPSKTTSRACLTQLGFAPDRAKFFASHIVVDPSRGAGHAHAVGAARRRSAPAHARRGGRHELQGLQHRGPRDRTQRRADLLALSTSTTRFCRACPTPRSPRRWRSSSRRATSSCSGSASPTPSRSACAPSATIWQTFEIAGVALVDLAVWHWMYAHPKATPAELRDATVGIAKSTWNKYYAPILGTTRLAAPRHLLAHDRRVLCTCPIIPSAT